MTVLGFALVVAVAADASGAESSSLAARKALGDLAHCTVKNHRDAVSRLVVEDWSPEVILKRGLITNDCLNSGTLKISPLAMKAALGEWLVATEKNEVSPSSIAAAPPLAIRPMDISPAAKGSNSLSPPKTEDALKRYSRYVTLTKLGECVVRADASAARALLGTKIGSNDEIGIARQLAPSMSKCVQAGTTIELTAETIRSAVGLTYYRLLMASRGITWRPGNGASEAAE